MVDMNRRTFFKLASAAGLALGLRPDVQVAAVVEEVEQEARTTTGLDAIHAAEGNVIGVWGTALTEEGVLLITQDGGMTWTESIWADGHGTDWSTP